MAKRDIEVTRPMRSRLADLPSAPDEMEDLPPSPAQKRVYDRVYRGMSLVARRRREVPSKRDFDRLADMEVRKALGKEKPDTHLYKLLGDPLGFRKYATVIVERIYAHMLRTFDPEKIKRPAPKTDRVQRRQRDEQIVEAHARDSLSIRALSSNFGVSKRVVENALHRAEAKPKRLEKLAALPYEAEVLVRILETSSARFGTFVAQIPQLRTRMHDEGCDYFDLGQIFEKVNTSKLNMAVALSGNYVGFSIGSRASQSALIDLVKRVQADLARCEGLSVNRTCHRLVEVPRLDVKARSGRPTIERIALSLETLDEKSVGPVFDLAFAAFDFRDPVRAKAIIARAMNSEGLHAISHFMQSEVGTDYETLGKVRRLLLSCCKLLDEDCYGRALALLFEHSPKLTQSLTDAEREVLSLASVVQIDSAPALRSFIKVQLRLALAETRRDGDERDIVEESDEMFCGRDIQRQRDAEFQAELGPPAFDEFSDGLPEHDTVD